jgi:carboxymethylenebutenolidase
MIEQFIDIPTKDGAVDTFVCHPERDGPHPVIIFYMDAPAIREELRDMARRFATVGYYVMLPNLYYRSGKGIELGPIPRDDNDPMRKRMSELMGTLSNAKIMDDTEGLFAYADAQSAAKRGPTGCVGYCMSGPFAVTAAGRFPERMAAAASIYGVRLFTDQPDSPHLLADRIKGEIYIACAEVDRWAPLPMVESLRTHFAATGTRAEVELYPGTEHGFAFPQRACFDKPAAERHWERLFALFRRNLG